MSKRMKAAGVLFWMGLSLLLLSGPLWAESAAPAAGAPGKSPMAARKGLTNGDQMQISAEDRCPVCGMFPAKRIKYAAAMVLGDGRTFYFCGNGCLLRTWRDPGTYLNVSPENIQRMLVKDYFSGETLDAFSARWVAGSDAIGPMGPALVALKNEAEVKRFKRRHGGKIEFELSAMTDELWAVLFPVKKKK